MAKEETNGTNFLVSNAFIAGMVALLTILTASAAYLGSINQVEGDDLDLEMQNTLLLASTAYLEGNQIAMKDFAVYEGYILNLEENEERALAYLQGASPELLAGIDNAGTPFSDAYFDSRYTEAERLYVKAESLQEVANVADDRTLRFQLAMLVFAFGLAMTGWASLADTRPTIIHTFVIFAIIALLAGVLTLIWAATTVA